MNLSKINKMYVLSFLFTLHISLSAYVNSTFLTGIIKETDAARAKIIEEANKTFNSPFVYFDKSIIFEFFSWIIISPNELYNRISKLLAVQLHKIVVPWAHL